MILFLSLLLFGCGKEDVTYIKGFPTEDSPGLTEFMQNYFSSSGANFLFEVGETSIYAIGNGSIEDREILYYQITEPKLKQYYYSLFESENPSATLYELRQSSESKLENVVANPENYYLPDIKIDEGNQLTIETVENKKTFDLPIILKEYDVKETDEIIYNIRLVNKDYFLIDIHDTSIENPKNRHIMFFAKQDLSEVAITRSNLTDFQQTLDSGKLMGYELLFSKVDSSGKYLQVLEDYGILDTETNKMITIDKPDLLSKDGEFVYINGMEDVLKDGVQKIQTVSNYLEGNDIYESEFKLSFKKIAKEMGYSTTGIGIADIIYFNEDYIVLYLNYKAKVVGTEGPINVIVDLQQNKNNPKVNIVDLGKSGM